MAFESNRNESQLALSQPNGCESIYGYKVDNVCKKNMKRFVKNELYFTGIFQCLKVH